jgi:hypothetical protein
VHILSRAKYLLFSIYAIKQRYKHEAGGNNWGNRQDSRVMKSFPHGTEPQNFAWLVRDTEVQHDIGMQIDKLEVIDQEAEIEDAR